MALIIIVRFRLRPHEEEWFIQALFLLGFFLVYRFSRLFVHYWLD
jgi:hypothetical protein